MNKFLAITYAFMLAYCPYDEFGMNTVKEEHVNATYIKFELGLELFNCINIYTGEETYQTPLDSFFNWNPYTQGYWLGVEYHKEFDNRFYIKAGVKHKCQHPMACWRTPPSEFNKSITEIYVGVNGKIDVF